MIGCCSKCGTVTLGVMLPCPCEPSEPLVIVPLIVGGLLITEAAFCAFAGMAPIAIIALGMGILMCAIAAHSASERDG